MTTPQIVVIAILAGLFALIAWGRWRYDVVAFGALLAAVLAGVVPPREAFAGFGHPATVTVALVLVLGRALTAGGATEALSRLLRPALGRVSSHVGALSGVGAAMSFFMNNVGTLGILMPVAIETARKTKRRPSLLLMPMSFGAILGGLVTLIGTPPNVIVATYRAEALGAPFLMFDFTPVGGVVMLAGLAFVTAIGWWLVPQRKGGAGSEVFQIESYLAEAKVPKGAKAAGMTLAEVEQATDDVDALVVGLARGKGRLASPRRDDALDVGDVLLIEADPEELDKFTAALDLKLTGGKDRVRRGRGRLLEAAEAAVSEAVVPPGAAIEGRRARELRLPGVTLLAVSRQGKPYRGRLKALRFRAGDVLLLHGEPERTADALARLGLLPLAERELRVGGRRRAPWILGVFAAAVAVAAVGLLPVTIAFAVATAAVVLAGLLPLRELYQAIDWPVIVLLGSLIPVGGALESTGATGLIAETILQAAGGLSPAIVLALVMVVTMTLSDVLNNAATAVVMAPIGVAIAERLGVSPDPFLMAVAVGASCAFLTPIGHQNNALILGPGGYGFGDYWRLGLPLEVLIVAVGVPMILLVWPL